MPFTVYLTSDAVRDLEELFGYISTNDSAEKADYVVGQIAKAFANLSGYPKRGAYPKELISLGIREYREIYFKPYRIIYRIVGENVYILLIADGRRDMQTLLQRRLLEA